MTNPDRELQFAQLPCRAIHDVWGSFRPPAQGIALWPARVRVVPGVGHVDNAEIAKGYEVDADSYVLHEPEEIEAIKLESKLRLISYNSSTLKKSTIGILNGPIFSYPQIKRQAKVAR